MSGSLSVTDTVNGRVEYPSLNPSLSLVFKELLSADQIHLLFVLPQHLNIPTSDNAEGSRGIHNYGASIISAMKNGVQERDGIRSGLIGPFCYVLREERDRMTYQFVEEVKRNKVIRENPLFTLEIIDQKNYDYTLLLSDKGVFGEINFTPTYNDCGSLGTWGIVEWELPRGSYIHDMSGIDVGVSTYNKMHKEAFIQL